MQPSLTTLLCTECGLCCDGSLFGDVELVDRNESSALEVMGLEVEEDEDRRELLLLPCSALKDRRCSIYAHRPECCRTFECRLLQNVQRGSVSVDRARTTIATAVRQVEHVKALIGQLEPSPTHLPLRERCLEALACSDDAADPTLGRRRVELEHAMSAVERSMQETFLGGTWFRVTPSA